MFFGPQNFAPLIFFLVCKGGNAMVETMTPLPKFFQAWALGVHFLSFWNFAPFFKNVHKLGSLTQLWK
jgi:hypothetical protein